MKTNKKAVDPHFDTTTRLAGGSGAFPAKQESEALLRRSVLANLLWEDQFYEDGISVSERIRTLVPQVAPDIVAALAIEARTKQKLRHVPLFLARELARLDSHKHVVGALLPQIILRADELTEFVALYWKDGKQPLSKQVKRGLAAAFDRFDGYQLAKYNRDDAAKLRDVLFLTHPKPGPEKALLFEQLANKTLPTPDTWEVALSAGGDKKVAWERLLAENRLGALAFVRNLRNMDEAGVAPEVIQAAFNQLQPRWLLPLNYLAAAKVAPRWESALETLMLRGLASAPKLPGRTLMVVDVSGSMGAPLSGRSKLRRLEAGAAMAVLAQELCENVTLYATAGSDTKRLHQTARLAPARGFALAKVVSEAASQLGGGGIFTRQCLSYLRANESETPERIIIFSDSQDCDYADKRLPEPFGKHNYIVDVSAHHRGINYKGVWTAEISGWSEHFLTFIATREGLDLPTSDS